MQATRFLTHLALFLVFASATVTAQIRGPLTGTVSPNATAPTGAVLNIFPAPTQSYPPGLVLLSFSGGASGTVSGLAVTNLGVTTFVRGYYFVSGGRGYLRVAAKYVAPPNPANKVHFFEAKWDPTGAIIGGWTEL